MAKRVRTYTVEQIAKKNARARTTYANKDFKTALIHRKKMREALMAKRKANPEKYRNMQYLRYYGVTTEKYNELLRLQGGRCAICRTDQPKGQGMHFHVDHDHTKPKGEVRGLLCMDCNVLLGKAKDQILVLLAAVRYLEEH